MAIVRPFNGMRYTEKAGEIENLCCPPYDIISEEERKSLIKKSEYNVVKLELPADKSTPYKKAKQVLDSWIDDGILKCDEETCMYIYGMHFTANGKEYDLKGIIGKVYLYEFERRIILPHENTLSKAKEDRFKLMESTACNFSPVYSLYEDEYGKVDRSIAKLSAKEPDYKFKDDEGTVHSLWVVPRCDEIDKISANMAGKKLYIADGHHRYETALRYRNSLREQGIIGEYGENEADYIMMMLVNISSEGLVVFPTHRVVKGMKKFSSAALIKAAQEYFTTGTTKSLETATAKLKSYYAAGEKAFCMYDGKKYVLMKLNDISAMNEVMPESADALKNLDVSVLHKLILEKMMGIDSENMASGKNLVYTRDENEAVSLVDSGEANCCFILNPTRVEEISAVAAADEKMPQKSTYFYPKLITGLVMNKLDRVPPTPPATEAEEKPDYVEPEAEVLEQE